MVFKQLIISEQIIGLFCKLSRQFIHSAIVIETAEPPSRITRRVFPVLSCSTYCGTIAPSIVQPPDPTNRRDLGAPRCRTARGKWRQWQRPIPEARPGSTTRRGNAPHRSRARRSDGDFCPSRRGDSNWTLNEELAVTRC
jgi:hypothetical protein